MVLSRGAWRCSRAPIPQSVRAGVRQEELWGSLWRSGTTLISTNGPHQVLTRLKWVKPCSPGSWRWVCVCVCVSVCTGCYLLTVEDPERRVLGNLSEPGIFQGPGETVAFRPDVPELLAVWLPRLSLPALSGSRGWALCATGSLCWLAGTSGLLGLPGVAPPFRLESVWEVLELLDGERVMAGPTER